MLFGYFHSQLSFLSSFPISLGDGPICMDGGMKGWMDGVNLRYSFCGKSDG